MGIIATIAKILHEARCNIVTLQEHVEPAYNKVAERFFARIECTGESDCDSIKALLASALSKNAEIYVHRRYKKNIVLFATSEYHCVGDILLRAMHEDVNARVSAVIANKQNTQQLCQSLGVAFHYIPCEEGMTREEHEQALLSICAQYQPEYIVMARYMRILSAQFINAYKNRIINIHHSFLPAFIGANPYRQAYERGVKIIGATAHFATEDLDEGPIIAQQVVPVDHSYNAQGMKKIGRDVEKVTLAKALNYVCEDKVFVSGNKTIIL